MRQLRATIAQMEQNNQVAQNEADLNTALALFIRNHYVAEIEQGKHAGRSLAEVVMYYLSVERMYSKMSAWKLVWTALTGGRGRA